MGNLQQDALELVRAVKRLAQEEKELFASKEECDFFRARYKPPSPSKTVPTAFSSKAQPPSPPISNKEVTPRTILSKKIPLPHKNKEPLPTDSFSDMRRLFSHIAPKFPLLDTIPKDDLAKHVKERWKTRNQAAPISLLFYQELAMHQKLLHNLAQALESIYGGARLIQCAEIEKENQWETFLSVKELSSVIICDSTLWQLPHLLAFYREKPSHSERFLSNTPLFLLPDLSLYLKDPLLKRSLWKALSTFQKEKCKCPPSTK